MRDVTGAVAQSRFATGMRDLQSRVLPRRERPLGPSLAQSRNREQSRLGISRRRRYRLSARICGCIPGRAKSGQGFGSDYRHEMAIVSRSERFDMTYDSPGFPEMGTVASEPIGTPGLTGPS